MEEEANRISQGQVPEMDSFVMTQKDALPPSFNAIFSPPEKTYTGKASTPPPASAPQEERLNGVEQQEQQPQHSLPVSQGEEEPHQISGRDDDSDEGVAVDMAVEKDDEEEGVDESGNPTDEEVDAVLAELDSIPDGGCDAEVDDEDDEDEWSYFKTEPRKQEPQSEDLLGTVEVPVDALPASDDAPLKPSTPENISASREYSPSCSPPAPSSPRTVEGFVTSVELNTPEESYNTNLAINQSTDYFNGGQIEQSSGPFSVYVSSSPEPASIESPPANLQSPVESPKPSLETEEKIDEEIKSKVSLEPEEKGPSVEIVHAQSTVEVMADSRADAEIAPPPHLAPENKNFPCFPDIMTQSFTGDLPTEPYDNRPFLDDAHQQPAVEVPEKFSEQRHELSDLERKSDAQDFVQLNDVVSSFKPGNENEREFVPSPMGEVGTHIVSPHEEMRGFDESEFVKVDEKEGSIHVVEDSGNEVIISNNAEILIINNSSKDEAVDAGFDEHIEPNLTSEAETVEALSSPLEDRFDQEINKNFEVPSDQMMTSFHEDLAAPNKEHEFILDSQEPTILENSGATYIIENAGESLPNQIPEKRIDVLEVASVPEEKGEIIASPHTPEIMVISHPTECMTIPPPLESMAIPPPLESMAIPEPSESMAIPQPTESMAIPPPIESMAIPPPTESMAIPPPTESVAIPQPSETPIADKTETKRPTSAPRTSLSKTSAPKPSPRTVGSKQIASKPSTPAVASTLSQSSAAKTAAKKPSSLTSTSTKPLRKIETTRPLTNTTTAKSRASSAAAASSTTTTRVPLSSRASSTSATRTSTSKSKTSTPSLKPKTTTSTTAPRVSSASTTKSRIASSTSTTKRLTPTARPSSTTVSKAANVSKLPNGTTTTAKPSPKTTTSITNTTRPSSVNPTKRPTSSKPLSSSATTTSASRVTNAAPTRKPLSTSTSSRLSTLSSSNVKPRTNTTTLSATKDTKNSTNRMLSTSRTSPLKSTAQTTSKTSTLTTRTRPATKATKPTLKTKKDLEKPSSKAPLDDSVANGENKIVDEESSVEVKEKLMAEEEEESGKKMEEQVIDPSSKTEEMVMANQEPVLVNGDH